jgi:HPt (histidine-containing phosphotransfer) domain-containing protein
MSPFNLQTEATMDSEAEGIVNPDRALERLGGSRTLYANVVGRFLDDTAGNFAQLRAAVSSENRPQIKRMAHSLKGLAAMCGAESMHDVLAGLEICDDTKGPEEVVDLMARVDAEMGIAHKVLRPYRETSAAERSA